MNPMLAFTLLALALLAAGGQLVFRRKRAAAFPVYPENLSRERHEVAACARSVCGSVLGAGFSNAVAWCTPQRDDECAEYLAMASPVADHGEMAQLGGTGLLGEWRVAVHGGSGECAMLLGLVESKEGFRVSFLQAAESVTVDPPDDRPEGMPPGVELAIPVAQPEHGAAEPARSITGRLGTVRQIEEQDRSGIPRIDRQVILAPSPERDRSARLSQLYDVASAISILLVVLLGAYTLYLTLSGGREAGQWSVSLALGALTAVASTVSGLLGSRDAVAANIELGANVRVFLLISLFTNLTTALVFGMIVMFAVVLAGTSLNAGNILLLPDFMAGTRASLHPLLIAFAGFALSRVWLGASTLYYAILRGRFRIRVFYNASREFMGCFRFARIRAALDALVSATWEEAVFRALIPSVLFDVAFANHAGTLAGIAGCVVIPAVLWSFMHSTRFTANPLYRFLELFLAGIGLGLVAWYFGVGLAMLVHWLFNLQMNLSHGYREGES